MGCCFILGPQQKVAPEALHSRLGLLWLALVVTSASVSVQGQLVAVALCRLPLEWRKERKQRVASCPSLLVMVALAAAWSLPAVREAAAQEEMSVYREVAPVEKKRRAAMCS